MPTWSVVRTRVPEPSRPTIPGMRLLSHCPALLLLTSGSTHPARACPCSPPPSTGKRSKEGALQDGINSAVRYVKNNFLDGPRQDAYDLVTGTWVPTEGGDEVGWLQDPRDFVIRVVSSPLLSVVLLRGMCVRD